MTSIKSKIYLIAIVDLIFNDNNQISFDDYTLEYVMNENKYNQLEIAVRLKNKINGNVDWGNLYYKPYDKASKNNIINMSDSEKINFVFTKYLENFNKMYLKYDANNAIDLDNFFKNKSTYAGDGYPIILLGGMFPNKAKPFINQKYDETLKQLKNIINDKENIKNK